MPEIDYRAVQKFADTDRFRERVADITLQPAGVARLCFSRTGLPTYTSILVAEAHRLIKSYKPSSVTLRNADSVNCSQWWKELLKKPFGGDVKNVKFMISGIRDNLKLNMVSVTPVVQDVISKLGSKKPLVFYIRAGEHSLVITSISQKTTSSGKPEKVKHTFEIELLGDWDWRYSYAKLLADVLPGQFCNLRKVYLVFTFKCNTCVKRVFEKLNWTFPGVNKDPNVFLKTVEADDLYFDLFASTRKYFNEFTIGDTNTKVRYFFQEQLSPEDASDDEEIC